jgi:hypothetical protein
MNVHFFLAPALGFALVSFFVRFFALVRVFALGMR